MLLEISTLVERYWRFSPGTLGTFFQDAAENFISVLNFSHFIPFDNERFNSDILTMRPCTVELQWLEHLRDYENLFETGVVRATKGLL